MALNIKKIIKERNMEVRDVAKKMGISPTGLSQHINGNPTVEVLTRIANAIGCDVSELFDKVEPTFKCPHCGKEITIKVCT